MWQPGGIGASEFEIENKPKQVSIFCLASLFTPVVSMMYTVQSSATATMTTYDKSSKSYGKHNARSMARSYDCNLQSLHYNVRN